MLALELIMPIHAILTDIEGTTSSIDFVHQSLFPYARRHLDAFLRAYAREPGVVEQLKATEALIGHSLRIDEAVSVFETWIDEDRKATPLKALQGMIWKQGYDAGELKGHVYPDTPVYLRRWHAEGKKLYIYSSGSVDAQKLIFGHTEYGDLTPLFSGYFDTRVGGKRESRSYRAILEQIGFPGGEVLFFSDIGEELDAAADAGIQTYQLVRDDKTRLSRHRLAHDFSEVDVDQVNA